MQFFIFSTIQKFLFRAIWYILISFRFIIVIYSLCFKRLALTIHLLTVIFLLEIFLWITMQQISRIVVIFWRRSNCLFILILIIFWLSDCHIFDILRGFFASVLKLFKLLFCLFSKMIIFHESGLNVMVTWRIFFIF